MKITSKEESKILNRIEVSALASHEGKSTPTKKEIKEQLSSAFKTKPELIAIKKIESKYGLGASKVTANIYEDVKILKKTEPKIGKKAKVEEKNTTEPSESSKDTKKDSQEVKDAKENEVEKQSSK